MWSFCGCTPDQAIQQEDPIEDAAEMPSKAELQEMADAEGLPVEQYEPPCSCLCSGWTLHL